MSEPFHFNRTRQAYMLDGPEGETRYRIVVPREFVDDEAGDDASEEDRLAWLRRHLPQILSAYSARTEGGWAKDPWSRILVEEID